jgi:hypothetical protein
MCALPYISLFFDMMQKVYQLVFDNGVKRVVAPVPIKQPSGMKNSTIKA